MRSLGVLVATTVIALLFSACETPSVFPQQQSATLRFGIFAADASGSLGDLATRYRPIADYLSASLARPVELSMSQDAGGVLAAFEAGRFDAVFNRAIAFPHAQHYVGAVPLVTRQEDRTNTTLFLASASDPRQTLQDFRGARLDFSLRLGSSYVMGWNYLDQRHIDSATFFSDVHYSAVADEALVRLREGKAELAVVNSQALVRLFQSGAISHDALKIVAETPPHVGQLWFASKQLPPATLIAIRDAFLALSPADPAHAPVLKLLAASGYVPVAPDDYIELTDLMRRLQMLDFDSRQLP